MICSVFFMHSRFGCHAVSSCVASLFCVLSSLRLRMVFCNTLDALTIRRCEVLNVFGMLPAGRGRLLQPPDSAEARVSLR